MLSIIILLVILFIFLFAMQIYYEGKFLSIIDINDEFDNLYVDKQDNMHETNLLLIQINWMPLIYKGTSVTQLFNGIFECKIYDNNLIISTSDNFGFRKHIYLDKKNIKLKKDIFIGYYIKFKIDNLNISMKLLNKNDYIYFKNSR